MAKAYLGNKLESFRKSPIVLFVLVNTFFRCPSNVNLTSKEVVWEFSWETLLLSKRKEWCVAFLTSCWIWFLELACYYLDWKSFSIEVPNYWFFYKSVFKSIADVFISCTTENREVWSANSIALDDNPSGKSLI